MMRQRVLSLIVALGLLLSLFPTLALSALTPAVVAPGQEKIPPDLRAAMASAGEAQVAYIVILKEQANLAALSTLADLNERRWAIYRALTAVAERTQKELLALLEKEKQGNRVTRFTSYWIFNGLGVKSDVAALKAIAARPEVAKLELDRVIQLPPVAKGPAEAAIQAVEWNIALVRAPQVWAMGYRGLGAVIGSIDTGVQWDHPALRNQYRGWNGAAADHDYNWFDAVNNNQTAPYDDNDHGTHTTGTAAGDDGGANQIGMAPQARWMAAKAFNAAGSGSTSWILAAMQWMQAPRNRQGQNPDPTKAPHVVNNSWGNSDPTYTAFQAAVQSWRAAGIFPVFSNGNNGGSATCTQVRSPRGPMGSPASYPESFGVGATDSSDNIASFSGRGPSPWQELKPEVSAPGVSIRSSVPGGGYQGGWSGTSMAAPHVTGLVALLRSIRPGMTVDFLEQVMMQAAVDRGLAGHDNCFGTGRIDAYAAAMRIAQGTGTLRGSLASNGTPVTATVTAVNVVTPTMRGEVTAYGVYTMTLIPGTYNVGARAFGYNPLTYTNVPIVSGTVTTRDFNLTQVPSYSLSGRVTNEGGSPLTATVTIQNTPLPPAPTNGNGNYLFPQVPAGTYQVTARANSRFYQPLTRQATIVTNTILNFGLPIPQDSFGYRLVEAPFEWIPGTTLLSGVCCDDNYAAIQLPFNLSFYGTSYLAGSNLYVSTNGFVTFNSSGASNLGNVAIPNPNSPNAAVYAFWDDLYVVQSTPTRGVYMATTGTAPNRKLVIEWRGVHRYASSDTRATFEIILTEGGGIKLQYQSLSGTAADGSSATVGIENQAGSVGLQYSYDEVGALRNGLAMAFVRGAAPQVSSVSPNWGARGDTITTTVTGANFQSGASVQLIMAGRPDIGASAVTVVSPTQINAAFNIPGQAEPGAWSLQVNNPDGQSATRSGAFTIYHAFQDSAPEITYDSWRGGRNSAASGGSWRYSNVAGSFIVFPFTTPITTTLGWKTLRGPNRGIAVVLIATNGQLREDVVDNYSPTVQWNVSRSYTVGPGDNVIAIVNPGVKNPSSRGYYVDVDGFYVGPTLYQETEANVWYNLWRGVSLANYFGGTARVNEMAGAVARSTTAGGEFRWVAETGPDRGIADLDVDGIPQPSVDNYSPSRAYRVLRGVAGFPPGLHVVDIEVSGRKNPASTGYWQTVDGILLSAVALAAQDDPTAMGSEPTGPLGSGKGGVESVRSRLGS